jgi:hypothetical protein
MPKVANPLLSISKKLEALTSKSDKLAQEIAELSTLVATEASKVQSTAPAPAAKKPVAKKASVSGEPKKRGRPAKAKVEAKPNYLSMLNAEPTYDTPTKKRGKK